MPLQMIARIPFRYVRQELERGQLIELKESPRDNQLISLGYFVPFDKEEHHKMMCDGCGKYFATEGFYIMHKKKPGGCLAPSAPISKTETAELLHVDPKKLIVED